jgi:DNA-binding PadR family transcriptional regulator
MGWPFRVTAPLLHTIAALTDADRSMHGWEIAQRAAESPVNVYRALQRLHDAGWVDRAWADDPPQTRPRRRMYWLTVTGRRTAPRLLAERATAHPPLTGEHHP